MGRGTEREFLASLFFFDGEAGLVVFRIIRALVVVLDPTHVCILLLFVRLE